MGLPLPAVAQSVDSVRVDETKDAVCVHVVGDHLNRPQIVDGWHRNGCLTLEWAAGLSGRGATIPVNHKEVASVWYGWFSSAPKKVRMQIRSQHPLMPTIMRTSDGWTITVGAKPEGPKTVAKTFDGAGFPETVPPLKISKSTAVAAQPMKSMADVVAHAMKADPFPQEVPPLDTPKPANTAAPTPTTGGPSAQAETVPVQEAADAIDSPHKREPKQVAFPETVPPLDAPKAPAKPQAPEVAKPAPVKATTPPAKPAKEEPFPETVPPLEPSGAYQSPALAAILKQPGAKITVVHHDPSLRGSIVGPTDQTYAMTGGQFDTPGKQHQAAPAAQPAETPFPDRVPPLEMAVKHEAPPSASMKVAAPPERLINLNCTDADLPQILKGLALQTGANIMISPDVKGKVTATLHAMPVDQALRQLATLTGTHYENDNGLYIFGREPNEAKPVTSVGPSAQTGPERSMERVVPIQSDAQAQIMQALESRFKESHLSVFSSNPSDNKGEAGQAAANAGAAGQTLTQQTTASAAAPLVSTVDSQVLPARFLILIGPASIVEEAAELAKEMDNDISGAAERYDKVTRSERELYAYDVKFADPRALREAVISQIPGLKASIPPNSAGTYGVYTANAQINQSNQTVGTSENGQSNTTTTTTPPAGGTGATQTQAPDDSSFEAPFAAEEKISVPMRLLLRGTHDEIQQAIQYLEIMDVAPKQVALELRVMDLDKQDALNAGIDWNVITGGAVKVISLNNSQPNPSNTVAGAISGHNFNGDVTASLDRIASKTNLIARPNLVALDGRQTEIFVGDIVRYVESITNSQNGTSVTTGEIPVGVRLSVLARVGADGNLTLDLRPRVSILDSFTSVPGGGELPQTSSRIAQSTISVKSGQTIAIGGLIQDQDVKSIQGVPFLMDLPFIGHLFKKTTNTTDRTELVFFLTVRALDGPIGGENTLPIEKELNGPQPRKGGRK